jgi:hypothetical protein
MVDKPVNNGDQRDAKGRFQPGRAMGRRLGSKNRSTALVMKMFGDEAAQVVRRIVADAVAGEPTAQKLVVERLCPVPKASRFVRINLPALKTPDDLVVAAGVIAAEVAAGRLSLDDVGPLVTLLESVVECVRTADHEARLLALERITNERSPLHVVR